MEHKVYFLGDTYLGQFVATAGDTNNEITALTINDSIEVKMPTSHLNRVVKPRSGRIVFHVKDSTTINTVRKAVQKEMEKQEKQEYERTKDNMW